MQKSIDKTKGRCYYKPIKTKQEKNKKQLHKERSLVIPMGT